MDIINTEGNKEIYDEYGSVYQHPCEHKYFINNVGRITNTLLRKMPWQTALLKPSTPPANLQSSTTRFIVDPKY